MRAPVWLLLTVLLGACKVPEQVSVQEPTKPVRFWALYMVGSDMEDDFRPRNGIPDEEEGVTDGLLGAGSDDLFEIVEGFHALSPTEQVQTRVLVAFGGARKTGWYGVRYADLPCLAQDAEDGRFGNAACYSHVAAAASMGDPATLRHFLVTAQQAGAGAELRLLSFWNHGAAYDGIGIDTAAAKDDLTLAELAQALAPIQDTKAYDLLGFDACLMGSLEVAHALRRSATYMIGSQEVIPGHGWNYTDAILAVAREPELEAVGKKLVDLYFDTPRHQRQRNKTLALYDLRNSEALVNSLGNLALNLDLGRFQPLIQALDQTEKFGVQTRRGVSISMDLRHWLDQLEVRLPESASDIASLRRHLDAFVRYTRQDGSRPLAMGLSLYSLNPELQQTYRESLPLSTDWVRFVSAFQQRGADDTQAPRIGFGSGCMGEGHCLTVSDNIGVHQVRQVFGLRRVDGTLRVLGIDRLGAPDSAGNYFMPRWKGFWFQLCAGHCLSGDSLVVPAYFETFTTDKRSLYTAEARLNGENIQFYLEVNESGQVVGQWAIPYTINQRGQPVLSKTQLELKTGDHLSFWYQVFDPGHDKSDWELGPELFLSAPPVWNYVALSDTLMYYAEASDFKGNRSVSDLFEISAQEAP